MAGGAIKGVKGGAMGGVKRDFLWTSEESPTTNPPFHDRFAAPLLPRPS